MNTAQCSPILIARDISHQFNSKSSALFNHVQLSIHANELVAITGPSGSGKSTFLHIISGLKKPTHGCVIIEDKKLSSLSDKALSQHRNEKIGFVYQTDSLLGDFNSIENICLPLLINGKSRSEALNSAQEVINRLNMQHLTERMPSQLSGGERQRIAIARALVTKPLILFADEPTGNLDESNTRIVMQTLIDAQALNKMTCVIATHDQSILKYFHRTLNMNTLGLQKNPDSVREMT